MKIYKRRYRRSRFVDTRYWNEIDNEVTVSTWHLPINLKTMQSDGPSVKSVQVAHYFVHFFGIRNSL